MSTNNGTKLDRSTNGVRQEQSRFTLKTERQESVNTTQNWETPTRSPQNLEIPTHSKQDRRKFEQPVLLQQSPAWSRAILWVLMGVTTGAIIWASVAKIEEAIPAQGKLEPQGTVQEVQAPEGGVVQAIHVEDGQKVEKGQRLLSIDPTAAVAQLASLMKIRTAITQENQFYQAQMRQPSAVISTEQAMQRLGLPSQLMSLVESRSALVKENQLFRAQLDSQSPGNQLTQQQIERLQSNQAELSSRVAADKSEVQQLSRQLNQNQIQIASAKDTVAMNQEILQSLAPLTKAGAISRLQYLEQQQKLRTSQAEFDQLQQERERLKLEINEAQSKLQNTIAVDRKNLLTQIAENDKSIAEIDSELTKAIVENNKRLAEIESQISESQQSLRYKEITAPASGTVFDLQAHSPGFVANTSQPVLKIVPDDALIAKVFITNKDIGFVREGMQVDVRVDSFPFSEFGDVKGELVWIGSDALPPDDVYPFYRFPAKVQIQKQSLLINNREVPLQSGMSLSANIKVRQRTVMSIFTDLFTKNIESLKFVR